MPISGQFRMDPSRLNAAVKAALMPSVKAAGEVARAAQHEKKQSGVKSSVSGNTGVLRTTGLGTVFETGRKGGYPIEPKGEFLAGGLTHPIRGPVLGGAMRAYPALPIGAAFWARGGYQTVAKGVLGSSGFGHLGP